MTDMSSEKEGSQAKKLKTGKLAGNSHTSKNDEASDFLQRIERDRIDTSKSVIEFKFIPRRVKTLSKAKELQNGKEGVVYWMSRDQRIQDNWAMLYAQKFALENNLSLHVCFCLVPTFLDATFRHFDFLLKGLQEVANECCLLNIKFHLLFGSAAKVLPNFVVKNQIGAVVGDFSPLRPGKSWIEAVRRALPKDVPLFQVDAHNIVPCWEASDKLEYAARTIRNKINSKLPDYLTRFPSIVKHPHLGKLEAEVVDWQAAEAMLEVDRSIGPVTWATPGAKAGLAQLDSFCNHRLKHFAAKRNDPNTDVLSGLSPWIHFGQISVQRCILVVKEYESLCSKSVSAFCEEAIVRRELADNFCFYNDEYDSIGGAYEWARITLDKHRADEREWVYSRGQLEGAMTADDLWNSAQLQLVKEGKMHGFLRMYWAKKILEWTDTPERALADAIYLNDRYSLDGRDPNGFVGCMWSICGIHDQGWAERPIFGKIRYMNYQGCKRKFDVPLYVARWGGKVHQYGTKK